MTKDEKIQSLLNDSFVLTKELYKQEFLIKYGGPDFRQGNIKKEDFLKYETLLAEI